jgi:hypothetical protein
MLSLAQWGLLLRHLSTKDLRQLATKATGSTARNIVGRRSLLPLQRPESAGLSAAPTPYY